MKNLIFLFFTLFHSLHSIGQSEFFLKSDVGKQDVIINGSLYSVDSMGILVHTNYPDFDKINFVSRLPYSKTPIHCNFKRDSSYTITLSCCGSFDIIPTSKLECDSLKYWGIDIDLDRIHRQLADQPFISIRTKNETSDPVFAWHADAACMTKHKVLSTDLWELGVPPKCYYWNNITTILFFKQDNTIQDHSAADIEELLDIENIVILSKIRFRLFDNERFIIEFDDKNNTTALYYE